MKRLLKDAEEARRAFEHLDPETKRALTQPRGSSINQVIQEIARRQLSRPGGIDRPVSEFLKRHSDLAEFREARSRLLSNQVKINGVVKSITDTHSVRDLLLNLPQAVPGIEFALEPFRNLRESYLAGLREWENLGQRILQQHLGDQRAELAALAAANWGANVREMVERITALEALKSRPHLAALMLEPALAYGRFAINTIGRLDQFSGHERYALEGSLSLANEQIVRITAAQESIIGVPEEEEGDDQQPPGTSFDLFEAQQRELLSRKEEVPQEADPQALVNLSPSAVLFDRCHNCYALIEYCNGASNSKGAGNIFNPATSWLLIALALAGKVTRDRNSFKDFVLNFYNLLCESVSPRRRLLREGLVTEAENRVIEVLKDFRNKWLVHDATQGSDETVRDDRRIIEGHLAWLGAGRVPLDPAEFERLQSRLLDEIEAFLALLAARLSPHPPEVKASMSQDERLIPFRQFDAIALRNAVSLWADATTDSGSDRHADLRRDKTRAVVFFFNFAAMHPAEVLPADVQRWREELEARGLKPNTVYSHVSRLSSFYRWLMKDPVLGQHVRINPALLARPKCPQPYQTGSTKSLTDEEMSQLLKSVKTKADAGSVTGKRDYALLLLFFLTGLRRRELIGLRGEDVELKEKGIILKYRRKGGKYGAREVLGADAVGALIDYLKSSDRMNVLESGRPLWTRHDRAGRAGAPLSSHSFVKNLKAYATDAGIKHIHLHQTRHTFARIFSEDSGSMIETQDALDHEHVGTTRAYVQTIAVKKDKFSGSIRGRMESAQPPQGST